MREHHSVSMAIEIKEDNSPVTEADKEINDQVLAAVKAAHPDHGVIGEEASNHNDEDFVWLCDPIDGTIAYINNVPTSMFSLALVHNGAPVVGVAYNPWVDELYWATKHGGAFCNNVRLRVSQKPLRRAVLGATGSTTAHPNVRESEAALGRIKQKGAFTINVPGSVFKGCLIASGFLEGLVFRGHGAHDIAATKLIIEEAGGKVTDLDGNEQPYNKPINGAVLSNGVIHNELLEIV